MLEIPLLAQQILVIAATIILIALLLVERIKPAYIFFGAVLFFLLMGIIDTDDFLKAMSNESVLSIFLLIFITFGIRTNFNILRWMDKVFGSAETGRGFVLRMTTVVSGFSSFLNNTPIVALFLPYVHSWSRERDVAPSKLLMPLSFAAMSGGMITVIGTSTNLVLQGLVEAEGATPPGFFDYLYPGLIVAGATVIFLSTIGYFLLPNNKSFVRKIERKPREYLVNVSLESDSEFIGKSVAQSGLQKLKGIDLFEINRHGVRISPVMPYERIQKEDILVFAGNPTKIVELLSTDSDFIFHDSYKTRNVALEKAKERERRRRRNDEEDGGDDRNLVETIIPANSAIIGHSLNSYNFLERFDAAVIGIHRNGEEIQKRLENVILKPADLLLLIPGDNFQQLHAAQADDLYVVSVLSTVSPVTNKVRFGFIGLLIAVLFALGFGKISLFFALLLLTSYLVAGSMVRIHDLKIQFSFNLFVVLFCSLAFSTALINSGVAELAANGFMNIFQSMGERWIIIGIYIVTLILTSFVTHVAAVAIIFPIAFTVASQVPGMNMIAVFIAIAFAASASFHTPFSYQTNMMVYGPGGYRFLDFLKVGVPLTILYSVLVLVFIFFYYGV